MRSVVLCCGRAIAVGQALADNHPKLKPFKLGRTIKCAI